MDLVGRVPCHDDRHLTGLSVGLDLLRHRLDRSLAAPVASGRVAPRRLRLHEIDLNLHCSVIGTCFGLGELRRLLGRIGHLPADATDHQLHHDAVLLAGRNDQSGKLLSKALDRKFKPTIGRFAAARDASAVACLWEESVARGDIPDAYWAVLSHPATTPMLVRRVFGEVHMLSHLVGAANRADIRRLQLLEQERDALEAKLERQQRHLTETIGAKERRIRELEGLLAAPADVTPSDEASAGLADALRREARRRNRLQRRVETLERRLGAAAGVVARATDAVPEPARNLTSPATEIPDPPIRAAMPSLDGATLLLVGGRPAQVPAIARVVAEAGGSLLHHDGGTEMSLGQLSGLASRADRMVLALDCVSHAAADAARRLARDAGKPLLSLPGLSLTSLTRALGETAA